MFIDIFYIILGLIIISAVSIILAKREKRLKKKLSESQEGNTKAYKRAVSSTKAKLERDIKRIQRKTEITK